MHVVLLSFSPRLTGPKFLTIPPSVVTPWRSSDCRVAAGQKDEPPPLSFLNTMREYWSFSFYFSLQARSAILPSTSGGFSSFRRGVIAPNFDAQEIYHMFLGDMNQTHFTSLPIISISNFLKHFRMTFGQALRFK